VSHDSLYTPHHPLIVGLANDSTDLAVSHPADRLTVPATDDDSTATDNHVVIPTTDQDVLLHFFGQNGDGDTFDAVIFGWSQIISTTNVAPQWTATFLIRVDCVCGTGTGVAAGIIDANDFWVDTISLDTANIGTADYEINSPVDNGKAYIILRHKGFEYLDVWFDMDAGAQDAVGCNVAWRNL
jgi:hypothetical protein